MLTAKRSFTSENPANTDDVVGEYAHSTESDVVAAVETAADAQPAWAAAAPARRAAVVGGIAHAIARQTQELVQLITREEGKTLAESRNEVQKCIEQFHFASQLAYLCEGATFPEEEPGVLTYTLRQPLGVVLAITPFNFPLSLAARKLGAALVTGNTVVFKPASTTAACGEALVRVCREAGLPDGVLQLVQGSDPDGLRVLTSHPRVRAITFTGSNEVGDRLRLAAGSDVRLQFELGGRNAAIVCADADLESTAATLVGAAFGLTGQACTSTDRILVEATVHDRLRDLMAPLVSALQVGPGTQADVSCGPVATRAQYERLLALAASATAAGAEAVEQGRLPHPDIAARGYYVAPTLFQQVPPDNELVTGEVFGPFVSLVPVSGVEEAVSIVNGGEYGLVTSIHTTDLRTAMRASRAVRSGVVKVNRRTTGNGIAPPFGGWRASSAGGFPEGGRQAIDFFTEVKTVYCGS